MGGENAFYYGAYSASGMFSIGLVGLENSFEELEEFSSALSTEIAKVSEGLTLYEPQGNVWAKSVDVEFGYEDSPTSGKENPWRTEKLKAPISFLGIEGPYGVLFFSLPGEVTTSVLLPLRREIETLGYHVPFITGYGNGSVGYMPAENEFEEGGYEIVSAQRNRVLPNWIEKVKALGMPILEQHKPQKIQYGVVDFNSEFPEPAPIAVPYRKGMIRVDGNLDDWKKVKSLPLPFMKKRRSSYKACWNETGLFLSFKAKDDSVTCNPRMPWTADCFELFFDGAHARTVVHSEHTGQFIFSPVFDGSETGVFPAQGKKPAKESDVTCSAKKLQDGYIMEIFISSEYLGENKPEKGRQYGLNFSRNNNGNAEDQFFSDKEVRAGFMRPISWGTVVLK